MISRLDLPNVGRLFAPAHCRASVSVPNAFGVHRDALQFSTSARFAPLRSGFRLGSRFAPRPLGADRTAKDARRKIAHGRALEFSRRAPRAFFSTANRVAKHFGESFRATQEVHLKAMGLLFRSRLGIDPPNVCFRIGIGSFFHTRCLTRRR